MKKHPRLVGLGVAIALGTLSAPILKSSDPNIITAQAQANSTPVDIESAYIEAVRTGQFRAHLSPYVHPELENAIDGHWLFQTETADTDSSINSTLRSVNAEDLALLEQYYQNYIAPTHVVEIEVSQPGVTNGVSGSTIPLYLQQTSSGWYIVFGSELKQQRQVESSLAAQQLIYSQSTTNLWQHNWDLRFEKDSPYRYTLQLRDPQSNTVLETFGTGDANSFYENQWNIRFWLQPEGASTVYQSLPQGGVILPYGYQIGSSAIAAATDLPLETVTQFVPSSDLRFEGDRLLLARLNGNSLNRNRDAVEKTLVIEVVRTAT